MAHNGNALDADETAQMFQQAEIVLKSMQIRDLPTFNGNPVKLHNFIRSVDDLFPFISALENTPFFNVWLQSIRAKIIGEADQILEIYGTPLIWNDIKANLIAYYNDKRDCVTLTRELFQVQQITTIEKFYGQVQNLLSLLINNTNILIQDNDLKTDRIATRKENALQVFLAGLKEPIGGNVRARKPSTLKEAFDACVEERNFQAKQGLKSSPFYPSLPKQTNQPTFSNFQPPNPRMSIQQTRNFNDNIPKLPVPNRNVFAPKPFPIYQPKPAPMEVDRSIRTKQVNYMNRPNLNNFKPSYPQQNRHFFSNKLDLLNFMLKNFIILKIPKNMKHIIKITTDIGMIIFLTNTIIIMKIHMNSFIAVTMMKNLLRKLNNQLITLQNKPQIRNQI